MDKSDQSPTAAPVTVYLQFLLSNHVCLHFVIGLWCAAMCYNPARTKEKSPLPLLSKLQGYYKCQLKTQSALSVTIRLY